VSIGGANTFNEKNVTIHKCCLCVCIGGENTFKKREQFINVAYEWVVAVKIRLKKRQKFVNAAAKLRLKRKTTQFINAAHEWVLGVKMRLIKTSTIRKCCLCVCTGGENTFKEKTKNKS
jgi:hypothetical protein